MANRVSDDKAAEIAHAASNGKATTVYADGEPGLSDVLDDLLGSAPEPTSLGDQIIAGEGGEVPGDSTGSNAFSNTAILTDRDGRAFDPSVHESNADGSPRLTSDNRLRRKRGRGASGASVAPSYDETDLATKDGAKLPRVVAVKHARDTVNLVVTFGQSVFGEVMTPMTKAQTGGLDEREYLVEKWADLYEQRGAINLPPELSVLIAMAGYVMPRFQHPEVKEKALGFFGKVKGWLGFGGADAG